MRTQRVGIMVPVKISFQWISKKYTLIITSSKFNMYQTFCIQLNTIIAKLMYVQPLDCGLPIMGNVTFLYHNKTFVLVFPSTS